MSARVRHQLAFDHEVRFPDRCIDCGVTVPGETTHLTGRGFHLGHLLMLFFLGRQVRIEVPICWDCREAMAQSRRRRRFAVAVAALLALLLFFTVTPLLPPGGRPLFRIGMVALILAPLIAWKALAPAPIELTVEHDAVLLEFREAELAADFARLNGVVAPDGPPPSAPGPSETRG